MNKNYYYNIENDLNAYPDCWLYIIIGGRNTGKTYSTLKHFKDTKEEIVFTKRTKRDIQLLASGNTIGKKRDTDINADIDFSPYKAINRDCFSNIRAFSIPRCDSAIGFWNCDDENNPSGTPVAYGCALSGVKDIKGFDLSECTAIVFDEFIPQPWERVSTYEGEQILDLYKTVSRDREHRGKAPLKLIALANAVEISNPLMNVVEVTDIVAGMKAGDIVYIKERGILIHQLVNNEDFDKVEQNSAIYKAMSETNWGRMAFSNEFAYNDFSSVRRVDLKNYKPTCMVIYKRKLWYIYRKNGNWYITTAKALCKNVYDLSKENDQKRFFYDYEIDIRNACIENKVYFEKYTMYDVIVNYKQFFKL